MRELNYLVKKLKDKKDDFYYTFIKNLNHNKFEFNNTITSILNFLKLDNDYIIIECTKDFNKFQCIYKQDKSLDENKWCIKKRTKLKEISLGEKVSTIDDNCIVPVFNTKLKNYFIISGTYKEDKKDEFVEACEMIYAVLCSCEINQIMTTQIMVDALTGLYNFSQFQKNLFTEATKISRVSDDVVFSVIALDIEALDEINDTYGYPYGDKLLIEISSIIKKNIRPMDEAFRMGGDEFSIILTYTGKNKAKGVVERILKEINKKEFLINNKKLQLKINVCIVEYNKSIYQRRTPKKVQNGKSLRISSYIKLIRDSLAESKQLNANKENLEDIEIIIK